MGDDDEPTYSHSNDWGDFGPAQPLPDGIRKEVLKEADIKDYKRPKKGDEVTVHYTGQLETGQEFDSSHNRDAPMTFMLGLGKVIKGWDLGIATMKKGEMARFIISPEYAYGEAGNPPLIHPNATLIFTVELIGWVSKDDLFGDGGSVIKSLIADGSGFDHPKKHSEVRISMKVSSGEVVTEERNSFDYELGSGELGPLTKVVEKTLLGMFKEEKCQLTCKREFIYSDGDPNPGSGDVIIDLHLEEVYNLTDCSILKDRSVLKKQITEGSGYERPKDGSVVTIKVEAAVDAKTGETLPGFEPKELRFIAGEGDVCDVLEGVVLEMSKDECASVTCPGAKAREPRLGLKEVTAAKVRFTVQLLTLTKMPDIHNVNDDVKVDYAYDRKEVAGKLFKMERYELALEKYKQIANLFRETKKMHDDLKPKALELKRTSELNKAACYLKLGDNNGALSACTTILREDPINVKALFRRAKAYHGRGDHADSVRDLDRLLEQEPGNKEALALLPVVKKAAREADKASKGTFSKMCQGFGRDNPKPKAVENPVPTPVVEEEEPRMDIVVVSFRIEYKPKAGETMHVVGSCEALGNNDNSKALALRKVPPKWEPPTGSGRAPPEVHLWELAVDLPEAEGRVEYRYIIRGPDGERVEPGKHAVNLAGIGGSRQRCTDSWRTS